MACTVRLTASGGSTLYAMLQEIHETADACRDAASYSQGAQFIEAKA